MQASEYQFLQPIMVGGLTFKNRIMFPPLTTGYEERDGSIGSQDLAFYTRLAKGGVGYIVLGDVAPIRSFSPTPKLFDDSQIEGFRTLADSVHACGAKLGVQIFHPEYDVDAINALFAQKKFDEMRARLHHDMQFFTDEASEELLLQIIDKMCACARRAQKAGVDVVQVHGDRLVGCLCSTKMNHRTDKFGGSLENRTRFALMLVRALKAAVPGMVIDYKFSVCIGKRLIFRLLFLYGNVQFFNFFTTLLLLIIKNRQMFLMRSFMLPLYIVPFHHSGKPLLFELYPLIPLCFATGAAFKSLRR